jgi:hypothetical protein
MININKKSNSIMNSRYILFAILFINALVFAQTPGISYQAVILDDSGIQAPGYNLGDLPLANANVDLKFTITDEDGTLYVEEFTGVTTDEHGMVSLILGIDMGNPILSDFSDIIWDGTPKDLGVEIDIPGDSLGYRSMGDPQPIIYIPSLDSRISSGEGAPSETGTPADIYIDESTGDLYIYDGDTWVLQGSGVSSDINNLLTLGSDSLAYLAADGIAETNTGSGAPSGSANPGDIYVDESTGDIYIYDGTSWSETSSADSAYDIWINEGHSGNEADFIDYLTGEDGQDGTGINSGSGDPNAGGVSGVSGDIYVDESTGDIYTYDGTDWTSQSDVVSTDADNIVVEGTDGLAYLDQAAIEDASGTTSGGGAPTPTNPANPEAGDVYVDETTGDVYTYDGTDWTSQSDVVSTDADNIVVEGTDGLAYLDQAAIEDASGTTSGAGAPTATNPANPEAGDVYVDETTGDVYTYDGTDWTSQAGQDGEDGASAYDIALADNPNIGTEAQWLDSLQGPQGDRGPAGPTGPVGNAGAAGDSAYDIWLAEGNSGTEAEFLTSLEGADGTDGAAGPAGNAGAAGDSAYDIWLAEGNSGTEAEFLTSLEGADGTDGAAGPTGQDGADGTGISGTGDPNIGPVVGNAGDVYVDESTGDIYTYSGGVWVPQDGSDDQTVDTFQVNGDNLELSIEDDGVVPLTIPLTDLGTDDQDATEVALSPALDMDSDGTDETTVQQALAELLTATTPAKTVFHAEYAGAVLWADGSDNDLFITSDYDNVGDYMNYYEVSNELTTGNPVQDYTINLQYTLPDDFHSWSSSTTAVTIDYSGTTDASFVSSIRANDSGSILATTSSQSGSGLSTTFSSLNLATSSQLSSLSAGDKITIAVRAHVTSAANIGDSIIRLGDITLNYNRNVL